MSTPIDNASVAIFKDLLATAEKIVMVMHVNPDGDAMGASLAMAHCLRQLYPEKELVVVSPNHYPAFLGWMDGAADILVFKDNRKGVKETIITSDLIICMDFNALSRLEDLGEFIASTAIARVLIDHHVQPVKEEFLLMISDIKASSTAELVYRLMKPLMKEPMSLPAAEAIMTGIMTDTNTFRDNASNPETFLVVAELLQLGVDKNKVTSNIYDNFSPSRMKLLGYALGEKMVVLPEYNTAYIALSQEELNRFNFQPGDTESFVNFPLNIKNMRMSAYISEQLDGSIRMSFRSRGNFSVNDFARNHFNGGGHRNAAGGRSTGSLNDTIAAFVAQLENYKDELQNTL